MESHRVEQASAAGRTPVHLVGGPVRDLLLGREIRDVDLIAERIGPADDAVGSDGEQVVVGGEGTAPVARSVAAELAEALASEDVRDGGARSLRYRSHGEGPDVTVDVASVLVSERYRAPGRVCRSVAAR